jgi:hypothetical protein
VDHRRYWVSKKGSHSVGVARQYCGQLGKQDNCRVAVSLSVTTHQGVARCLSAICLGRPTMWAAEQPLVPDDVCFQTSRRSHCSTARRWRMVPPALLMDPAYGNDSKLRADQRTWLTYVAGIRPPRWSGGLARCRCRRPAQVGPAW